MKARLAGTATICVLALLTAGCAAEPEQELVTSRPGTTAKPTQTPAPTETAFAPDCTNIVPRSTAATLEAEGFVLVDGHEDKSRAEDRIEQRFFDFGGVDCLWGIAAGGDSLAAFGYSPITPAEATDAQAWLDANGYLRTTEGSDVVYNIDPERDVLAHGDVFLFDADAWYHANLREWIDDIRAAVAK